MILLSDLHLGSRLDEQLSFPDFTVAPKTLGWFARKKINRYFRKRCKSHDLNILKTLPHFLNFLRSRDGIDFDFYLVLGDIVTLPSVAACQLAQAYLTNTKCVTAYSGLQHECTGLGIPLDRLIAIPGNHDKMLLTNLDLFNQEFAAPLGLPVIPKSKSYFIYKRNGQIEFLFIIVEANIYCAKSKELDKTYRRHLAKGAIKPDTKKEIKQKIEQIRAGNKVDHAQLDDFKKAFKILLIHYAADDTQVAGRWQGLFDLVLPHQCEGLTELLKSVSANVDLLIHGHLHQPAAYAHEGVQVLAATTTTQMLEKRNGFHLLKFYGRELHAEEFLWDKNTFVSKHTFAIPLYK